MTAQDRKLSAGTAISALSATDKFYGVPGAGTVPWGYFAGSVLANYFGAALYPIATINDGEFIYRSGGTILGRNVLTGITSQFWLGGWTPTNTNGFTQGTQIETSTNKVNIINNSFPASSQKYGVINHALPSDYNGGTVTAKFFWTANSSSTNSVVWGLQGGAFADDGALDTAYGTAQEVTDANGSAAYTNRISAASSAITIAGSPAAGQLVSWRAYRLGSGSDNLAVAASLIGVMVTYVRA